MANMESPVFVGGNQLSKFDWSKVRELMCPLCGLEIEKFPWFVIEVPSIECGHLAIQWGCLRCNAMFVPPWAVNPEEWNGIKAKMRRENLNHGTGGYDERKFQKPEPAEE